MKERYTGIFKKSLLFGLVSFTVNLLLICSSADQEIYNDLFRLYNSLIFLISFLYWVFNRKMRKYVRSDFKYQEKSFFTMYQRNFGMFAVSVNFIFQMILRGDQYVFRFFRSNDPVAVFPLVFMMILPYILHTVIFFILINFYEHKKALGRMQDFLNIHA